MKKSLILLLCVCLFAAFAVPLAHASEEPSPLSLEYALRIEGASDAEAKPGDVVTVVFSIRRIDGRSGDYSLRIVQNEILFDEEFFEYVPDSASVLKSGNALYQTRTDGTHIIKASYLSPNGGVYHEDEDFCSFQLRVKGTAGSGWVRCDPACAKAYDGDNLRVAIQTAEEARLAAGEACHPFEDVQKSDWYHEAVDYVWQHSLMNGMGDNRFEPGRTMTRAMVVTVLYRLQGSPATSAENIFTDVDSGQWYTDAVVWASENGIVLGYGDGRFGTNDDMTREQIATILRRFSSYNGLDVSRRTGLSAFEDSSSVSSWAQEAMEWAVAVGLINGRTPTTLVPGGSATRAEVATLLMRYCRTYR